MSDEPNAPVVPTTVAPAPTEKMIPQSEVNALIAGVKRSLKAEVDQKTQAFEQLRSQVEQMLQGRPIEEIREEMETTASKLRTVEENAQRESLQYQNKLKAAQETSAAFEKKYRDSTINRSFLDASLPKALNAASADLIGKLLHDFSPQLDENGVVTVEMEIEEDGVRHKKRISPEAAVDLLEAQPSKYGPLFKSFVSSGTGTNSLDGIKKTKTGKLDVSSMSMEEYAAARNKNPDFLRHL